MLLKEIKHIFHAELDGVYPKGEVDSFFYLMIEHYLSLQRFVLALEPNTIVSKEEEQPLFDGLSQLKLQKPIQYILGVAHFMDMEFKVDENVLIPRPETEELVRWILEQEKKQGELKILDIGTGSGCIAIALAKNLPNAKVFALDISAASIAVAKENAIKNQVSVEFIKADILQLEKLEIRFDVIVSNPPYVRELEKKVMNANVTDHEPAHALFVSNENPLLFYKKISEFAVIHLNEGGNLYFEINQYLGNETIQLIKKIGFSDLQLRKDMFGNDRMLKGKLL
ncbi:peptide chain release factor N(5)-glutamine methyltransferase [Sediminicola arcticus]|jgi:release factor glutamine methyltransferase|uniref:Release factor glutamine methyltransferase n=1 Tax=Sediminicola arcticus TaxID=1574308 RepID=A0ABV2ST57_9FLAO